MRLLLYMYPFLYLTLYIETIISSFPQRWAEEEYREQKVLESIQTHLRDKNRPQVDSVYKMTALIVSLCIGYADKCRVKGERFNGEVNETVDESFFDIFAGAISTVVSHHFLSLLLSLFHSNP
jgi:hypothetical protein